MNKKSDIQFHVIGEANIQDNRRVVISEASDGTYTLSQQAFITQRGVDKWVFLKHSAIIIENREYLDQLIDAFTKMAICLNTSMA